MKSRQNLSLSLFFEQRTLRSLKSTELGQQQSFCPVPSGWQTHIARNMTYERGGKRHKIIYDTHLMAGYSRAGRRVMSVMTIPQNIKLMREFTFFLAHTVMMTLPFFASIFATGQQANQDERVLHKECVCSFQDRERSRI